MQGAARTALHKEHAEIGNDVTMRKKGRINEEKKRKGTKINPEKNEYVVPMVVRFKGGDRSSWRIQGSGAEEVMSHQRTSQDVVFDQAWHVVEDSKSQ